MKLTTLSVLATLVAGTAFAADSTLRNPLTDSETWQDLRYDIVGDTEISDGSAAFDVDAPYRAHDAATVPLVVGSRSISRSPSSQLMIPATHAAANCPTLWPSTTSGATPQLPSSLASPVDNKLAVVTFADSEVGGHVDGLELRRKQVAALACPFATGAAEPLQCSHSSTPKALLIAFMASTFLSVYR